MRERFDAEGRIVSGTALASHLVELTGRLRVVDLRRDATLDLLGCDDQISTSRAPGVWAAGQLLADRLVDWFGERLDGIVYRSRTTPARDANLAFFGGPAVQMRRVGLLRDQEGLLAALVAADGFLVEGWNAETR